MGIEGATWKGPLTHDSSSPPPPFLCLRASGLAKHATSRGLAYNGSRFPHIAPSSRMFTVTLYSHPRPCPTPSLPQVSRPLQLFTSSGFTPATTIAMVAALPLPLALALALALALPHPLSSLGTMTTSCSCSRPPSSWQPPPPPSSAHGPATSMAASSQCWREAPASWWAPAWWQEQCTSACWWWGASCWGSASGLRARWAGSGGGGWGACRWQCRGGDFGHVTMGVSVSGAGSGVGRDLLPGRHRLGGSARRHWLALAGGGAHHARFWRRIRVPDGRGASLCRRGLARVGQRWVGLRGRGFGG